LRAIVKVRKPTPHETEIEIPAESRVILHGDDARTDAGFDAAKNAACFALVYNWAEWKTISSLLRSSDELRLRWVGADNNGYLRRATVTEREGDGYQPGLGEKLYHDRLHLEVWRNGKQKYAFYVTDSVCPDNTARMIRPGRGS
jgi:hypothetical protein